MTTLMKRVFIFRTDALTNDLRRGSATVETAMIMPVILLVVMGGLYMTFHVHNRAFLALYAIEQAVSGHEQPSPDLTALSTPERGGEDGKERRKVSYTAESAFFGGPALPIQVNAVYEKVKPCAAIWEMKAFGELAQRERG